MCFGRLQRLLVAVALLGALFANLKGREGWAFAAMGLVLLLAVGTLFGNLWPNVMPSTTNAAFSLTVRNASSSPYTLGVMSWVALFATPIVLLYEGWSYWVFRKRVMGHIESVPVTTGAASTAGRPPVSLRGAQEGAAPARPAGAGEPGRAGRGRPAGRP